MKKIILAALSIVLFSCSSDSSVTTNTDVAHFEFKINNTAFVYKQENFTNPSFINEYNHSYLIGMDPYYRVYSYNSTLYKFNYTTTESIGIEFSNLYESSNSDDETNNFFTIFNNKPTNFTSNNYPNQTGISVNYTDINGNYYTSNEGEQDNSLINYTSTTESTLNGYKRVVIEGTVNCKLYNILDTSQILNLTNGKFKLIFEESNL
ncbi:MAG: hypothetical protein V4670_01865 [Bacteroidota bacterium]